MPIRYSWEQRVQRARDLATRVKHADQILTFYAEVLSWQQAVYVRIAGYQREGLLTGRFECDFGFVSEQLGSCLELVRRCGSGALVEVADEIVSAPDRWKEMLSAYWNGDSTTDESFFAQACFQPYLEVLAEAGIAPSDSDLFRRKGPQPAGEGSDLQRLCPFCGRSPQVAFLSDEKNGDESIAGGSEGGRKYLMCGDCQTIWPFPRVSCVGCEETTPAKLPYYSTAGVANVRIDCCDTCKQYIKTLDLTKDRRLIPTVDELAALALDLCAEELGYTKIQRNLAGI